MAVSLPSNVDNPLPEPPPGCAEPEVRRQAYEQIVVHQPGSHGQCRCGQRYPCPALVTAIRHLMSACGLPVVLHAS